MTEYCAKIAERIVREAGGKMTFRQYDVAMSKERYFAPIYWIEGWDDVVLHKQNNDKMCAFVACNMGLIKQTRTGYKII